MDGHRVPRGECPFLIMKKLAAADGCAGFCRRITQETRGRHRADDCKVGRTKLPCSRCFCQRLLCRIVPKNQPPAPVCAAAACVCGCQKMKAARLKWRSANEISDRKNHADICCAHDLCGAGERAFEVRTGRRVDSFLMYRRKVNGGEGAIFTHRGYGLAVNSI